MTSDSVDPTDPVVVTAQGATRQIVLAILVGSVLVQAIRLVVSRKAEPLVMVATGLVRFLIVSALGLTLLHFGLVAGDAFSRDVLDDATGKFATFMEDQLGRGEIDNVMVTLLVALLSAILSCVQWLLMIMRQAGLLVMAAMLPLAASGSLTRSTRGWLNRLIPWLLAIAVYKPAAAFIYYIGFSYLSSSSTQDSSQVAVQLSGVMVLLLAVVAMPVLLKFFAWSGTQVGGASGGSAFLGAAGALAMTSGARSAVDRARQQEMTGPGSGGGAPPPQGAAQTGAAMSNAVGAAAVIGSQVVGKAGKTMTGEESS
ncbi:hypothetical protein [Pseudonocardia halophobica]|uniref:hypothetical protein n=1 Tax=Pseudonocardia halophobica TaxID=29401 RepID=UPI0012DEAC8D|nr:hypothetical protein [Pseudonocardia halophobica]